MDAISLKEQDLIVKNVVKACSDIEKLNSKAYKFLHVCAGFIAHYNLYGFRDHYSKHSLVSDILNNKEWNKYLNFREGDSNYQYYKSKADTYAKIVKQLHNQNLNLWNT